MLLGSHSIDSSPPSRKRLNCSVRRAPKSRVIAMKRFIIHSGNGMPREGSKSVVESFLNSSKVKTEPLLLASFEEIASKLLIQARRWLRSVQNNVHSLPRLLLCGCLGIAMSSVRAVGRGELKELVRDMNERTRLEHVHTVLMPAVYSQNR